MYMIIIRTQILLISPEWREYIKIFSIQKNYKKKKPLQIFIYIFTYTYVCIYVCLYACTSVKYGKVLGVNSAQQDVNFLSVEHLYIYTICVKFVVI